MKKKIVCSVVAVISIIFGSDLASSVHVSEQGFELIGNAEGCRLSPYKCPAGLITNGIGNTHNVPNKTISYEQVAIDWVKNIQTAEQCLFESTDAELSQGNIDAFTSFIFNVGCGKFKRSTMHKYLHKGDVVKACHELPRWVYAGKRKLPGLIKRRDKELELCLQPD